MTVNPGDVVSSWFRGAVVRKKRPAVVVSTGFITPITPTWF